MPYRQNLNGICVSLVNQDEWKSLKYNFSVPRFDLPTNFWSFSDEIAS